ncbi:hypothetical protein HK100_005486 [Physocladia obscura]|uniref:Uncharacterized protein n=1 Tax=Physocladia obscura TaxID=109957 RepID=A0AAD5XCA1_9FUNG|nr:hypothetical protein HK100_005486 [Physocladia obscura]
MQNQQQQEQKNQQQHQNTQQATQVRQPYEEVIVSDQELRQLEAQAEWNASIDRLLLQGEHDKIVREMREQLDKEKQEQQLQQRE